MEFNITFHTPINFDIGLCKHQLLYNMQNTQFEIILVKLCIGNLTSVANKTIISAHTPVTVKEVESNDGTITLTNITLSNGERYAYFLSENEMYMYFVFMLHLFSTVRHSIIYYVIYIRKIIWKIMGMLQFNFRSLSKHREEEGTIPNRNHLITSK